MHINHETQLHVSECEALGLSLETMQKTEEHQGISLSSSLPLLPLSFFVLAPMHLTDTLPNSLHSLQPLHPRRRPIRRLVRPANRPPALSTWLRHDRLAPARSAEH